MTLRNPLNATTMVSMEKVYTGVLTGLLVTVRNDLYEGNRLLKPPGDCGKPDFLFLTSKAKGVECLFNPCSSMEQWP